MSDELFDRLEQRASGMKNDGIYGDTSYLLREAATRIRLLEQQLKTAREEERERCAKVADGYPDFLRERLKGHVKSTEAAKEIAAAIRSLGEKEN